MKLLKKLYSQLLLSFLYDMQILSLVLCNMDQGVKYRTQAWKRTTSDPGSLVGLCMQDYKSLCSAVMI